MTIYPDDQFLIDNIRRGDESAYNMLATKYLKLLNVVVNQQSLILGLKNISCDDYLYTYFRVLKKCVNMYDNTKACFEDYFFLVLKRKITQKMLEEINRNDASNNALSLDDPINGDMRVIDLIEDTSELSPLSYTNLNDVKMFLRGDDRPGANAVDQFKYKVIILRIFGLSLSQIAKALNVTLAKVRYIVNSVSSENYRDIVLRLK